MHDLVIYAHVFGHPLRTHNKYSTNRWINFLQLLQLFQVKPIARQRVLLYWQDQQFEAYSGTDGFVRFQWKSDQPVPEGWHEVTLECPAEKGYPASTASGLLFVPHITQFCFISDIDDTILQSHSRSVFKQLRELLFNNPRQRKLFNEVVPLYRQFAEAQAVAPARNPFFYVSSSEWNLYDYILDAFRHHGLPEGAFLLNQIKRWYQLFQTGRSKHEGKLLRMVRLLELFPHQRFVLLGDNSQKDPNLYSSLVNKYADRILAVYIRNVRSSNTEKTSRLLAQMHEAGVQVCFFREGSEAMAHAQSIGLLRNETAFPGRET